MKRASDEYIIAIKEGREWLSLPGAVSVSAARDMYDRGTHTIAQGRHADGLFRLYLIPLKNPVVIERHLTMASAEIGVRR